MYTLEDPRSVAQYPIEGMRNNWEKTLSNNFSLLKSESEKRGYLLALQILSNSFLPHAYLRAEPIARLEMSLNKILFDIKHPKLAEEIDKELAGQNS